MNCEITQDCLHSLLEIFEKKAFEAGSCEKDSPEFVITTLCEQLLKLDYSLIELDNTDGSLSPKYPSKIFIPEYEIQNNGANVMPRMSLSNTLRQQKVIFEDLYDTGKIRELITMAKYARCRQRFVVPVIIYRGKYICRSATISVMPETYGRKVVDYAYDCINGKQNQPQPQQPSQQQKDNMMEEDPTEESLLESSQQNPFSYTEVIKSDVSLMKTLNVSTIIDLMVEQRKVKYFMTVSSSEKADPENHYEGFNILSLPYPGCEFFKEFRDNNYIAKNLQYDWNQSFIDTTLKVPKNGPTDDLDINWSDYKKWDLVLITQNYLKAALKYIQDENSGILVHCISGWDRTPLFISLIRLSLWADGLIHRSLSAMQITYFTLAYDWYLFGHQLPDRLNRGEDIMFFCFHVLKFLIDDEFSIGEQRKRTKTSSSSGSSSVIVLRTDGCDDESLKENEDGVLAQNFDQDSNDSFMSNCDMPTNDNYSANSSFTSRSPNPKRTKTNPISVPGISAHRRRNNSTSSNSSWLIVSETGSIDSTANCSYATRYAPTQGTNGGNSSTNSGCSSNGEPSTRNNDNPELKRENNTPSSMRKIRLNAVRSIFIQAYGKTIGLKFKEGSSMTLAAFVGTIAEQLF